MTVDLVRAAHEIADALTETLDDDQRIGYLDVLDACDESIAARDHV